MPVPDLCRYILGAPPLAELDRLDALDGPQTATVLANSAIATGKIMVFDKRGCDLGARR